MWATFWDALQEVGGRKIVIALVVLALIVGLLFNRAVKFGQIANVNVIYQGSVNMGPWPFAVPSILGGMTFVAGMIWLMLMIFTGGPQFVAMLEKGWRELTFSKGTPRWQILISRFASLSLLFCVLILATCAPLAVRLWWATGVSTLSVVGGALILTFVFASLLAIAALASMASEGGVALTIVAPIGGFVASQWLVSRERLIYEYITSELGRRAIDWIYYILPKCSELQNAAQAFVQSSAIPSSWPLWTTGLFILTTLTLTMWLLERKSF